MLSRIRVLIVDDSIVMRGALVTLLGGHGSFEVVGVAQDGHAGLEKLRETSPDVVILDIEMPKLDGLGFLTRVRAMGNHTPVIVFSSVTSRGAMVTIEALSLGARDYVLKPNAGPGPIVTLDQVRIELVTKLIAVSQAKMPVTTSARPSQKRSTVPRALSPRLPTHRPNIVAIGSSTGGPQALTDVLTKLPGSLGVPIVIAQHMPPLFTVQLAKSLNSKTELTVKEAVDGEGLAPGVVYVAPGDFHLVTRRHTNDSVTLRTIQTEKVNGCRPSVDVLFESVAEIWGATALAIVLTGMGSDGLEGSRRVIEEGGQVIAQDAASSVVWSMPKAVWEAGLAEELLSIHEIGPEILRRARGSGV